LILVRPDVFGNRLHHAPVRVKTGSTPKTTPRPGCFRCWRF